jgi:hypothetical protein
MGKRLSAAPLSFVVLATAGYTSIGTGTDPPAVWMYVIYNRGLGVLAESRQAFGEIIKTNTGRLLIGVV